MAQHNHTATCNTSGNHSHTINAYSTETGGSGKGYWFARGGSLDTTQSAGNHTHTVTISSVGSNTAHNNIPPYITTYIWRRTA